MCNWISIPLELGKANISMMAALSAVAGHALASRGLNAGAWVPAAGTYLLALGACTLNQVQERGLDSLMARTKGRPLPSGRITVPAALLVALAEFLAGFSVLLLQGGLVPWGLGILAVVWYNGLYTPLKRRTAFAAVPGAVIGAIPPLIGWTSASGPPGDPRILALAFFFFLWQVPHFWLLLLLHSGEYESAGFPTLTARVPPKPLSLLLFVWTAAAAVSSLMIPFFGATSSAASACLLAIAALAVIAASSSTLFRLSAPALFRRAFLQINLFALAVILIAILDPYLFRHIGW